jgi:hypothetical protein
MGKILTLLLTVFSLSLQAANSPVIYQGDKAKVLLNHLNINDKAFVLTGTQDPTVTATDGPKGSLLLSSNGNLYAKQDVGLTTNWSQMVGAGGGSLNVDIHDASGADILNGQQTMANSVPVVISSNQTAVPISGSVSISGPISGSVGVTNFPATQAVSAVSLPLPTGAATSALQTTGNTTLSTISGKLPAALGAQLITGSVAVNIASNQTVPVSGTFFQATQPVSGTVAAAQSGTWTVMQGGAPWTVAQSGVWSTGRTWTLSSGTDSVSVGNFPATQAVTQSTSPWIVGGAVTANAGSGTFTVGQATGTNLHTVVDSGSITVSNFPGTQPVSGTVTANIGTTGSLALESTLSGLNAKFNSLGQKSMATSAPVVISSDQSSIPVTGTFFQATQPVSGTVTALQGSPPWSVSQSGTFTTGRTWTLSSGSDSVSAVQSGIWTAGQGTPNTIGNAWPVKITDGTNSPAIKGAVTAPTTADPSLVVAISPNSPISVTSTPPTNNTAAGMITASCPSGFGCGGGSTIQLTVAGFTTLAFETHGTWSAVMTQDVSYDPLCSSSPGTVLWYQTASFDTATNESLYVTSWGFSKNDDPWVMSVAGAQCARLRASSYTSGTVAATLGASVGTAAVWAVATGNTASGSTDVGNPVKVGGVYNTSLPTLTTGQRGDLQLDSSGRLLNAPLAFGTDSVSAAQTGVWSVGRTWTLSSGSDSVTAAQSGTWNINNITGTVSLPTGAATEASLVKLPLAQGSTTAGQSGVLTQGAVTTAAPSYTTAQTSPLSLTTAGALRVDGSAVTQPISGTVTANQGGSWTAASPTDGPVSPGTAAINSALIGGVYRTSAPVLANGQQVGLQVDVNGNLKTLATVSVTSVTQGDPNTIGNSWPVKVTDGTSVLGTPANPLRVDTTGTTTQPANIAQINDVTPLMGNGTTGTGSLRVTVASNNTAFSVNANQAGTWNINNISGSISLPSGASTEASLAKLTLTQGSTTNGQSGPLTQGAVTTAAPSYTTAQTSPLSLTTTGGLRTDVTTIAGTTTSTGNGVVDAGVQRVAIASDNTAFSVNASVSQINSVTPLMGNGVTGTGSQRVTIASDNTPFVTGVAQASTTSGQSGPLTQGAVTTAAPSYTTAQTSPLSLTTAGSLRVDTSTIAGTAVSTGNGVVGAGVQRVAIASNNTVVPVYAAGSPAVTYSAAVNGLTAAATPTDVFTITGSASRTVRIKKVSFSGTQTTSNDQAILLIKRSTADTGGTSAAVTAVPNDSNDAAASATALSYTANPTLGTTVGTVRSTKLLVTGDAPGNNGQYFWSEKVWTFGDNGDKEIILRGTAEVLAVNLNATATMAGSSLNIDIEWTEE